MARLSSVVFTQLRVNQCLETEEGRLASARSAGDGNTASHTMGIHGVLDMRRQMIIAITINNLVHVKHVIFVRK